MDCIGVGWMTRSINRSCHQLGACSRWNGCLLGSIFHGRERYFNRYNVVTYNLMFYVGREWVDRVWMALDDGPECCYLILDNYF
jgi:hypothetical protein